MKQVQIGDKIHIIEMIGEPEYTDTKGVVKYIWGSMIVGTWGNKPLVYTDRFEIVEQICTYNNVYKIN